jgi:hypothetical protein
MVKNRKRRENCTKRTMATKINPPIFSKSKSYELYKQELLAWSEITDLDKKKRGVAIAHISNRPKCVLRGNGHINFHSSIGI